MKADEKPSRAVRIVVSMGDPYGIGPEICQKMAADTRWRAETGAAVTVVGSLECLRRAARICGTESRMQRAGEPVTATSAIGVIETGVPVEYDDGPAGPVETGGKAGISYIERAFREVEAGRADALVTCPISKEALSAAGSGCPGHTEMLGSLSGCEDRPVMMMAGKSLRIAFVTTHMALADLPGAINTEKVIYTARVFVKALRRYFDVENVKTALCALNPHAGDGGRFGREEIDILRPAIDALRGEGIDIEGPLPADTVFYKASRGRYNGVVALYHDQGMIPVKMQGPSEVVNITLGLPLIRTSPAHGTAYDIAGKGVANPESLKEAIRMAVRMAGRDGLKG